MDMALLVSLVLGALFAGLISVVSYHLRLLTFWGTLAQFAAGWLLFGLGGWQWGIPIFLFFSLSALLSRLTGTANRPGSDLFAKGETRDEAQVAANGGLASILVLPWFLTGQEVFYVAYLGAVGAAAADTWATEIGMTSARPPRSILTFQALAPGQSGGITPRGLMAGALGGMSVTLAGIPWLGTQLPAACAVASAAFGASVVDSILGATVQLQYSCPVCRRQTERPRHCAVDTVKIRGYTWITNDAVNLLASVVGAMASAVFYMVTT